MKKYVGISDNRMKHMLGVARKAYSIAEKKGLPEIQCRSLYTLGLVHDIGYEFSETGEDHARVGTNMLLTTFGKGQPNAEIYHTIELHSQPVATKTIYWAILSAADMSVDSKGRDVGFRGRLKDIKKRYGKRSEQYKNAKRVIADLKTVFVKY